jgi:hypothetical protein
MAFLDNSGDIILDAVLTDTGRARLAKGDGSFKITKFALGDDEIDYTLYNKDNPSGSAYYDLEIMQTPILEAFTNNTSTMKSKLISISRTNLLYLPVILLNEIDGKGAQMAANNIFYVAVNDATENEFARAEWTTAIIGDLIFGANPKKGTINFIRLDQGLNTTEISPALTLDPDLVETQYIIEMDNRFGSIVDINNNAAAVSFVDDDQIASYYLSRGTDPAFVKNSDQALSDEGVDGTQVIAGPKGTTVDFKIRSSLELTTSDYLFQQLGVATIITDNLGIPHDIYQIDSTVRLTGATTGYRVDIPVRFIRNR